MHYPRLIENIWWRAKDSLYTWTGKCAYNASASSHYFARTERAHQIKKKLTLPVGPNYYGTSNVVRPEYLFYLKSKWFDVNYFSTYKYAKALCEAYPFVYFDLMGLDLRFVNNNTPEEAVIAAIAEARLNGWGGQI